MHTQSLMGHLTPHPLYPLSCGLGSTCLWLAPIAASFIFLRGWHSICFHKPTLFSTYRWTTAPPHFPYIHSLQMTTSFLLWKQSDNDTGHDSSPSTTKRLPQQPRGREFGWFTIALGNNGADIRQGTRRNTIRQLFVLASVWVVKNWKKKIEAFFSSKTKRQHTHRGSCRLQAFQSSWPAWYRCWWLQQGSAPLCYSLKKGNSGQTKWENEMDSVETTDSSQVQSCNQLSNSFAELYWTQIRKVCSPPPGISMSQLKKKNHECLVFSNNLQEALFEFHKPDREMICN